MDTWRKEFKPMIAEVIARVGKDDLKLLRKELRDAFPLYIRGYHPYKIWLDEIRVQLGTKKKKQPESIQSEEQPHFFKIYEPRRTS